VSRAEREASENLDVKVGELQAEDVGGRPESEIVCHTVPVRVIFASGRQVILCTQHDVVANEVKDRRQDNGHEKVLPPLVVRVHHALSREVHIGDVDVDVANAVHEPVVDQVARSEVSCVIFVPSFEDLPDEFATGVDARDQGGNEEQDKCHAQIAEGPRDEPKECGLLGALFGALAVVAAHSLHVVLFEIGLI